MPRSFASVGWIEPSSCRVLRWGWGWALAGAALLSPMLAGAGRAATITVTSAADPGTADALCTLREAIVAANTNAGFQGCAAGSGSDLIQFNVANGPVTITVSGTALPALSGPATIDGTPPPAKPSQTISLAASAAAVDPGLALNAGSSTVRALSIRSFPTGVRIDSSGNVVAGCRIGTDLTGSAYDGTTSSAVEILSGNANRVGGSTAADRNVLAGSLAGVTISGGTNGDVRGNYIGTNATGLGSVSVGSGIRVFGASGTIIGGLTFAAGNVVNGATNAAIFVNSAPGTQILGNRVGLNPSGNGVIGNQADGITIFDSAGVVVGDGAAGRNLIAGNGGYGVSTSNAAGEYDSNYVGVGLDGETDFGNGLGGLLFDDAEGLASTVSGNVVSGNAGAGITVNGQADVSLFGNRVGTDADGLVAVPNAKGIVTGSASSNVLIGPPGSSPPNVVAGNTTTDVELGGSGNAVYDSIVGLDAGGSAVVAPGAGRGIYVLGAGNAVGAPGDGNTIGGSGVLVDVAASATGTLVRSNQVGTNLAGNAALGGGVGIGVAGAATTVGGTAAGEGNRVVATTCVSLSAGTNIAVLGNDLGILVDGSTAPCNRGVLVNAADATIGNVGTGGNRIASSFAGIQIESGAHDALRGNVIYQTGGPRPVVLGAGGPLANDPDDVDSGANGFQNWPVLASAVRSHGSTSIPIVLDADGALGASAYTIDLYASTACHSSGQGPAHRYLGTATLMTNAAGDGNTTVLLAGALPGDVVAAMATSPTFDTSELSTCVTVAGPLFDDGFEAGNVGAWGASVPAVPLAVGGAASLPVVTQATLLDDGSTEYRVGVTGAAPSAAIALAFDVDVQVLAVEPSSGSCQAHGRLVCTLGTLAGGELGEVRLVVRPLDAALQRLPALAVEAKGAPAALGRGE